LKYPSEESQKILNSNILPALKEKKIDLNEERNVKECIYVCQDFTCSLPMYSIAELKKYFNNKK